MSAIFQRNNSAAFLDVVLDSALPDVILLSGSAEESAGTLLKGKVVLNLPEVTSITKIALRFYGHVHLTWVRSMETALHSRTHKHDGIFFDKEWSFLPFENKHRVGKGSYEYKFETVLPGDICESVEGFQSSFITYKMKAVVERPRFSGNNLKCRKGIRVIRSLSLTDLEMAHSMSVENVWPNKIRYCIEIPTKAVMIGSVIPITIKIESLLKGLTIGKILISLREYYTFDIPNESTFTDYRIVKSARLEDPDPEEDLDMWKIVENLKLPGTLSRCSQDCETGWIKVRHKIKFHIPINNPDGHVSELRASLPVSLHIPETHPTPIDNELEVGPDVEHTQLVHNLPLYQHHIFDRRFGDHPPVSSNEPPSGTMTPHSGATSGSSTPYMNSRRNSLDLGELTSISNPHQAAELQNQLEALSMRRPDNTSDAPSALNSRNDYFNGHPDHISRELGDLSRVPSYNTASTAAVTPISTDLPAYSAANCYPDDRARQVF